MFTVCLYTLSKSSIYYFYDHKETSTPLSTLRAISVGDSEAYYENGGRHDAYFLIVDKISERLDQKIKRWKKKQALMKVCQVGGLFGRL